MVLYNLAILLYLTAIRLGAFLGHKKANLFLNLRKNQSIKSFNKIHFLIHAASAGEGNQAIPIAQHLKKICNCSITISFFSPAGFQFHANSEIFDQVINIPIDKKRDVEHFIKKLQPNAAIFIKNELWLNLLNTLENEKIPSFLVNAAPSHFLKNSWSKKYQFAGLQYFKQIYLTQQNPFEENLGLSVSNIYGDTKYESAFQIKPKEDDLIAQFCSNNFTIIVGSSWRNEEKLIQQYLNKNSKIRVIIAPHEVDSTRIDSIKNLFPNNCSCYSDNKIDASKQVLILDKIGLLRFIYHYADVAVIGGGFGKGIHNTLEAIAQFKPVIIGPKYQKFDEVTQLVNLGLIQSVNDSSSFNKAVDQLYINETYRNELQVKIEKFVLDQEGIANQIATDITKLLSDKLSV